MVPLTVSEKPTKEKANIQNHKTPNKKHLRKVAHPNTVSYIKVTQ